MVSMTLKKIGTFTAAPKVKSSHSQIRFRINPKP